MLHANNYPTNTTLARNLANRHTPARYDGKSCNNTPATNLAQLGVDVVSFERPYKITWVNTSVTPPALAPNTPPHIIKTIEQHPLYKPAVGGVGLPTLDGKYFNIFRKEEYAHLLAPPAKPAPAKLSKGRAKVEGAILPYRENEFFTDGSLTKLTGDDEAMQSAILDVSNGEVLVFHADGPTGSTEPELQPILQILLTHKTAEHISIYTDSEASVNLIKRCVNNKFKITKSPHRATLRELVTICKDRAVEVVFTFPPASPPVGVRTLRITHVYSHSDKNKEKKRKNCAKFGEQAKRIIQYNNIVDKAAGKGNTQLSLPHSICHPSGDPVHLVCEGKSLLHLYKRLERDRLERWKKHEPARAGRFMSEWVDDRVVRWTFSPKSALRSNTTRTIHRAMTATLSTKTHVINRTSTFSNKPKTAVYSDELCEHCKKQGNNVRESNEHVLADCPLAQQNVTRVRQDILDIVADVTGWKPDTLPWWFGPTSTEEWLGPEVYNKMRQMPKDLAMRGFVPKALRELLTDYVRDYEKIEKALQTIATRLAIHIESIWSERCIATFGVKEARRKETTEWVRPSARKLRREARRSDRRETA